LQAGPLEQAGRRLGYSHGTVSRSESGQWRGPRVSLALKLADAPGVVVEDLFRFP
jgi:DNA-binding XRE family transcriptional regulator